MNLSQLIRKFLSMVPGIRTRHQTCYRYDGTNWLEYKYEWCAVDFYSRPLTLEDIRRSGRNYCALVDLPSQLSFKFPTDLAASNAASEDVDNVRQV